MSQYTFSAAQRNADWIVHGEKCYICTNMVGLASTHVDHVIPESLSADSERLASTLTSFGLPANFDLNSFANWMPSCAKCNVEKGPSYSTRFR